jgi:hypothetical protein
VVEQPLQLGGGEVGVDDQAGLALDAGGAGAAREFRATRHGTAVLPDDGAADGFAAGAVPQHGGFALVGDADGRELRRADPRLGQRLPGHGELGVPDVVGVVLHPAWVREMLRKLLLRHGHDPRLSVEDDGARARRALVQGKHMGVHGRQA